MSRSSSPRNQRDARRRLDPTLPEGAVPSETGLLGPLEVKAISEALGIRPTKVLGQNFVHDAGTVRKIVAVGGVEEGDEVVEVGPGLGSLTLALLEVGARVRAVEIDPPLAAALPETVRARMSEPYLWMIACVLVAIPSGLILLARNSYPQAVFWTACL